MLPTMSDFLWHPFTSIGRTVEVFKLDTIRTSEETAERRKRKIEEAQKRRTYRVAHGLESADGQGIEIADVGKTGVREEVAVGADSVGNAAELTGFEGKRKPIKKWFGIW